MKKIIGAFLLVSFSLLACKKDKSCDLSQSEFTGAYKISALKYKASTSAPEVDEFALFDACEKDDVIHFNANGTITFQDAGVKCVPPGDDIGTWTLAGNLINIDGEIGTVAYFDCNSAAITIAGTTAGEVTTVSLARQ